MKNIATAEIFPVPYSGRYFCRFLIQTYYYYVALYSSPGSNSQHYHGENANPCPIVFLLSVIMTQSLVTGEAIHLHPPKPDPTQRVERLPSAYIRQMADERFLVPGVNLTLLDTIGQGEWRS